MEWLLLLAGLILLSSIPIELVFEVERFSTWHGSVRLRWLFGLVRVRLRRRGARPAAEHEHKPRAKSRPAAAKLRRLATNPAAWRHCKRQGGRLWRALRPRDIRLHARFGFDDPADTGLVWAALGPALAVLVPTASDVHVTPVFMERLLELRVAGRVRVILPELMAIILVFVLSPTTWRLLWSVKSA